MCYNRQNGKGDNIMNYVSGYTNLANCDNEDAEFVDEEQASCVHYYQDANGKLYGMTSPTLDGCREMADAASEQADEGARRVWVASAISGTLVTTTLLISAITAVEALVCKDLSAFDYGIELGLLGSGLISVLRTNRVLREAKAMQAEAQHYEMLYTSLVEQEYKQKQAADTELMFR